MSQTAHERNTAFERKLTKTWVKAKVAYRNALFSEGCRRVELKNRKTAEAQRAYDAARRNTAIKIDTLQDAFDNMKQAGL